MMISEAFEENRISVLVVDDEISSAVLLAQGLRNCGFKVEVANSGENALKMLSSNCFDVLLTDYHMPSMNGCELMKEALKLHPAMAVLLLTASSDLDNAVASIKEGAADYISKPCSLPDVIVRIKKACERQTLIIANKHHHSNLEKQINDQADRLLSMFQNSLLALNHALEAKDEYTRNHSTRVSQFSFEIAKRISPFDTEFQNKVKVASLFHDIGKIGVPEAILLKPGILTPKEFKEIEKHPVIGETILKPIFDDHEMLSIVRNHHERWDGSGYPDMLVGEQIPLGARIVAIADSYDAMTSTRAYRSKMAPEKALKIIEEDKGKYWDPEIVLEALKISWHSEIDEFKEFFETPKAA